MLVLLVLFMFLVVLVDIVGVGWVDGALANAIFSGVGKVGVGGDVGDINVAGDDGSVVVFMKLCGFFGSWWW